MTRGEQLDTIIGALDHHGVALANLSMSVHHVQRDVADVGERLDGIEGRMVALETSVRELRDEMRTGHVAILQALAELTDAPAEPRELTEDEREERAGEACRALGIEYTPELRQAGQAAWAKVRAHRSLSEPPAS